MDDLTSAMKNGKAGGATGVLPEMVKAGCGEDDYLEKDAKPSSNIMDGEKSAKGLVRCRTCTDTEKG